jgi:hypothetical protein
MSGQDRFVRARSVTALARCTDIIFADLGLSKAMQDGQMTLGALIHAASNDRGLLFLEVLAK